MSHLAFETEANQGSRFKSPADRPTQRNERHRHDQIAIRAVSCRAPDRAPATAAPIAVMELVAGDPATAETKVVPENSSGSG